jgi:hypothetical protein
MKVETQWLIDYYQKQLDETEHCNNDGVEGDKFKGNSYKIDFLRNAIDNLKNEKCPICKKKLNK